MGKTLTIGGLDPSLSNFGMAKAKWNEGQLEMVDLFLSESPVPKGKKGVRKNSEDLERARKHVANLATFFNDVDVICVEIPVGSQSARAMASYGICIGILSAMNKPLIQVTPAEVKEVVGKNATKREIIDALHARYPDLPWLVNKDQQLINKNEHMSDACASILAGTSTDQFKLVAL